MASVPTSHGSQQQFNKIPILGLVPETSATVSPPASPTNGQLWYDNTVNRLMVRENGAWVLASQTGTVLSGATAGGDLTGTYPNPTVDVLKITAAKIANATITDTQVATANKDGVAGTASMRTLGTGAQQAVSGTDSRLSDTRVPTGTISGDLAGSTYPALNIAALAVTAAKIALATITDAQIAVANKSGAVGVESLRQIGTGALQAMAGNTNLSTIAAPSADVALNAHKITGLADPTAATDAATKQYVDAIAVGLDPKASVRLATAAVISGSPTYNATGGTSGRGQFTTMPTTVDSVTLAAGNRVLVKDQATGAQNGIWVVTTLGSGANGVWDRASDFDTDAEVTSGAFVFVEEGTVNDNSGWVLATNNPITIGGGAGTALVFNQFSGAGSIIAGTGLTKTGATIDAIGTAGRISVAADSIDIDSAYVGQTSITTLGTIATGAWAGTTIPINKGGTGQTTAAASLAALGGVAKYAATLGALVAGTATTINHALNTTDVGAFFKRLSDGNMEELSWAVVDANNITVTADMAYSASAIRVVVLG